MLQIANANSKKIPFNFTFYPVYLYGHNSIQPTLLLQLSMSLSYSRHSTARAVCRIPVNVDVVMWPAAAASTLSSCLRMLLVVIAIVSNERRQRRYYYLKLKPMYTNSRLPLK